MARASTRSLLCGAKWRTQDAAARAAGSQLRKSSGSGGLHVSSQLWHLLVTTENCSGWTHKLSQQTGVCIALLVTITAHPSSVVLPVCRLRELGLPCSGNKQALLARLEGDDAAKPADDKTGSRAGRTAGAAAAAAAASGGRQGQRLSKATAKPQARQNFVRINMRARPLARMSSRTMLLHGRSCSWHHLSMIRSACCDAGWRAIQIQEQVRVQRLHQTLQAVPARPRCRVRRRRLTLVTKQQMPQYNFQMPRKLSLNSSECTPGRAIRPGIAAPRLS